MVWYLVKYKDNFAFTIHPVAIFHFIAVVLSCTLHFFVGFVTL